MNYYHYTISVFLSHLFLLWLNLTFTAILFFSTVSAPGCMKLNLSRPVKTSPGDCMTSNMKANTNCSFSCLQGYQLQGPPLHCVGQTASGQTVLRQFRAKVSSGAFLSCLGMR